MVLYSTGILSTPYSSPVWLCPRVAGENFSHQLPGTDGARVLRWSRGEDEQRGQRDNAAADAGVT